MGKILCVLKKNKLYVYEVKTNLKFYKIKEQILKKYHTHVNGICNFSLEELEYYANNEEVKIDGSYTFIEEKEILPIGNVVKMFYKGIKYPDILNHALLLRDGDVANIDKLNEFRAPVYIQKMRSSKKKMKLLENYPFNSYVDDIISCFSLKKIKCLSYSNMEDLVKKIECVTKYNDSLNQGDKEMFKLAKKAELSMFIPEDYGNSNSGIYRLKQLLAEHKKMYTILKEISVGEI